MNRKIINIILIILVITFAVGSLALFTNGFDEYSFKVFEAKTRIIKEGEDLEGFYLNPDLKEFTKKDFDKLIEGIEPTVLKNSDTGEVDATFYVLVEFDSWSKEVSDGDDLEDLTLGVLYHEDGDIDLLLKCGEPFVIYDSSQNRMLTIFDEMQSISYSDVSFTFGGNVAHVSKVNNGKELKNWIGGIFA